MPSFASNDSKGDWDESLLARDRQGLGQAVAPPAYLGIGRSQRRLGVPHPPS